MDGVDAAGGEGQAAHVCAHCNDGSAAGWQGREGKQGAKEGWNSVGTSATAEGWWGAPAHDVVIQSAEVEMHMPPWLPWSYELQQQDVGKM